MKEFLIVELEPYSKPRCCIKVDTVNTLKLAWPESLVEIGELGKL
jgi:hypothetical protein